MSMKTHRIRLEPTMKQVDFLLRCCGTHRYTWNWALNKANEHYQATKKTIDLMALKKVWNAEKPEWVYETPRDCNSQPFADLKKAFAACFRQRKAGRKHGLPKFKKRGKRDAFYLANDQASVRGRSIRIPKLGYVKLSESLRFEGKVMCYRVSREADEWFVSVQVEVGDVRRARRSNKVLGVDLGIKALATTSDGQVFENPMPLKKAQEKLRRAQRVMARRVKGSARRGKAKIKVARLHQRVRNIRQDCLHKLTTHLCRESQVVVIEDLNVKGMVRNHCLAQAISDAGFGEFRRQLTYKAQIYGTEVVVADRFYPSSKTCSGCGFRMNEMPLSVREWDCPQCGMVHDRDVNAAKNLAALAALPRASREVTIVDKVASTPRKSRVASRLDEAISTTLLTCGNKV